MTASENPVDLEQNDLRKELVIHFRREKEPLCQEWLREMTAKGFLVDLTKAETERESITIYDTCIGCLETGQYESAEEYAKRKAERGVLKAMTAEQFLGGMLTLRDIYGRSLFDRYRQDRNRLNEALGIYEPVANKILSIIAFSFIEQREKVIRQQQQAILELSTPVLQLRPGLLILPIVGLIDSLRAKQLTEQLLKSIRANRSKVAVIDITGVPNVDSKVANHILMTVEAARLMGAKVIVTGISPEIAQTIVAIGVTVNRVVTVSDLQSGVEEAEHILGYKVIFKRDDAAQNE